MVVVKVTLRCDGAGCTAEAEGEVEIFHHAPGHKILKRPQGWGWGWSYLMGSTLCPACVAKDKEERHRG